MVQYDCDAACAASRTPTRRCAFGSLDLGSAWLAQGPVRCFPRHCVRGAAQAAATAMGYGGVKYADLKNHRMTNYKFSFDNVSRVVLYMSAVSRVSAGIGTRLVPEVNGASVNGNAGNRSIFSQLAQSLQFCSYLCCVRRCSRCKATPPCTCCTRMPASPASSARCGPVFEFPKRRTSSGKRCMRLLAVWAYAVAWHYVTQWHSM